MEFQKFKDKKFLIEQDEWIQLYLLVDLKFLFNVPTTLS